MSCHRWCTYWTHEIGPRINLWCSSSKLFNFNELDWIVFKMIVFEILSILGGQPVYIYCIFHYYQDPRLCLCLSVCLSVSLSLSLSLSLFKRPAAKGSHHKNKCSLNVTKLRLIGKLQIWRSREYQILLPFYFSHVLFDPEKQFL